MRGGPKQVLTTCLPVPIRQGPQKDDLKGHKPLYQDRLVRGWVVVEVKGKAKKRLGCAIRIGLVPLFQVSQFPSQ